MAYGLIAVVGAVALALWFVFATEAPLWSKALIAGLLAVSFMFQSLIGLLLKIGLGVVVLFYLRYLKALT